ncbi:9313_t:CDS:2 [Gigaspora rosea]|nr:9313_t:CDS:2 [Gigaspora rosea]
MSTDSVNDPSEMKFRSSFSYKNDNISVVEFGNNVNMRIERINPNVATIYFVDDRGNSIQIPNGVTLRDTLDNFNETPQVINGFGTYFVSWISDYVLLLNGVAVFALKNQKQQSLEGEIKLQTRVNTNEQDTSLIEDISQSSACLESLVHLEAQRSTRGTSSNSLPIKDLSDKKYSVSVNLSQLKAEPASLEDKEIDEFLNSKYKEKR